MINKNNVNLHIIIVRKKKIIVVQMKKKRKKIKKIMEINLMIIEEKV
jgi:hypothetical protein